MAYQAAILTIGDEYAAGKAKDEAADALSAILLKMGWEVPVRGILGDDEEQVATSVAEAADSGTVDAVFTIDGVGILARDRASEAMYRVCERWITGMPELIRAKLCDKHPAIALYRGLAGVRGRTLIVNLPGTPVVVKDALDILKPNIRTVVEQLKSS